ncbi:hypothetical protein JMM81_11265 [Bacillus sp. V3B]|uniref:hypothetical protein n=1 Tax=Bacillus sp. V3B TaxID=2804915 RepID=UPI00210C83F0|nr:hypothetical protein [Bacillus sp. V3B]MCQ6275536.1 hypothetical protein [Bacillus sp. V3B]
MQNELTYEEIKNGDMEVFSKTVSEFDIYQFAGITDDFNPMYINEEFADTVKVVVEVIEKQDEKKFIKLKAVLRMIVDKWPLVYAAMCLIQHESFNRHVYQKPLEHQHSYLT